MKKWQPKIVQKDPKELIPYSKNAKVHTKMQVKKIAASIDTFGFTQPIVTDKDGVIILGHGRREAAISLAMKEVPTFIADHLSDEETRALRIADNRVADAPWDADILKFELGSLDMAEFDLSSLGFEMPELGKFLNDGEIGPELFGGHKVATGDEDKSEPEPVKNINPNENDPDEVPEVKRFDFVKPGDIWLMGNHRLMCGSSIEERHIKKLMNGEFASIWSSDPPYGISYVDKIANEKGQAAGYQPIANDDLEDEALKGFIFKSISLSLPHMNKGFAFYMWHAMKMQAYFSQAAAAAGILFHRQIIWMKPQFVFGRGHYHWRHELCLMGWLEGNEPPFYGERNQTTVWEIGRENDKIHPTQKPVAIWEPPILNHTKSDEIIYEPFAGSGGNFIAAEKHGRRCFGMELDPHYCAIILRRFAEYTGTDPVRESDGALFSDLLVAD